MNPNNQAYYSSNPGPGKGKRILIVVGIFVLVAAAIGYFVTSGQNDDDASNGNNTATTTTSEADKVKVLPLSAVTKPSFVAPKDMKDYNQRKDFTADIGDYTTKNNGCNIQFGVVSSIELPGTTLEEIASLHLGAGAATGAVGGEPEVAKDLVLYNAKGTQRYAIPTFEYSFTRDGTSYRARYSVILISQGDRAYVRTYCANDLKSVDNEQYQKVNDKAKQIRIDDGQ